MLKRMELINYKSFKNVTIDFSDTKTKTKNIAIIYGENGSGKSNIISALYFLKNSINTLSFQKAFNELLQKQSGIDLNAFTQKYRYGHVILKEEIQEYKMLNTNDNMIIKYYFLINGKDAYYKMEFDNENIVTEELSYVLDKNISTYFNISSKEKYLNKSIFNDTKFKKELEENIDRYFGKHTFLSILKNEYENVNASYLNEKISNNMIDIFNEIRKIDVWQKSPDTEEGCVNSSDNLLRDLRRGSVLKSDSYKIEMTKNALNAYFTSLYSDIKEVYYTINPQDDKLNYMLHFKKMIGSKMIEVPYYLESTGTIKLLDIFPYLLSFYYGDTVFIDEIDSGVHDLLMAEIISNLALKAKGQLVITTHNTLLMTKVKASSLYIIEIDAEGNKKVSPITDKDRIQKNNNVAKGYLNGNYGGVPSIGYLDFDEILNYLS